MPSAALKQTGAIAQLSPGEKIRKIENQQSTIRELRTELKDVVADSNKKINRFAREGVKEVAIYGGAGAAAGALAAWFLFDKFKEWFGAESYVGLLATAAVGLVVIVATPSLITVTRKSIEKTGPVQAASYGVGVGVLAVGLYRAYQEWPQG